MRQRLKEAVQGIGETQGGCSEAGQGMEEAGDEGGKAGVG